MMAAMDRLVFDAQQFAIHQDEARFMDVWQNISNILHFLPQLAGFFPEIGESTSLFWIWEGFSFIH